MKPAPFVYHAPRSLSEAARLLKSFSSEEARILAGGQSLVPMMSLRLARPAHLIDINRIEELNTAANSDNVLHIGATVRHARFQNPEGLGALGPMLSHVVQHIAHYPIRQRGTFCGSIAHADPASEWCLVAATLDATIQLVRDGDTIEHSAKDFFSGAMTTSRADDEILRSVGLAQICTQTQWAFEEFAMRAGDFAQAMTLCLFDIEDNTIVNARIGVGAVEPVPRRMTVAEQILNGSKPTPDLFMAAGEAVAHALEPTDDWQGSGADKGKMAGALVRRALQAAMEKSSR